ncbi:hypothetical protein WEH80_36035 [Actinomycetes bacterium KLBMP 9759]
MSVFAAIHRLAARSADEVLQSIVPRTTAEATCGMHSKKCCIDMQLGYQKIDVYGQVCSPCIFIGGHCNP